MLQNTSVPNRGRSIEELGPRIPLHNEKFAGDPHRAYREMRAGYGSLVPVEIAPGVPAALVVSYRTAVRILNDAKDFTADPRSWQQTVPANLPIMPMIEYRPNALRSSGEQHKRYRKATKDALDGVDLYALHHIVNRAAVHQINQFCEDGAADLLSQYCGPLVFSVLNQIIGCPPEIGARVAAASAALFEGVDTMTVNAMFDAALLELTALKRADPGDDIATRLVQHPARLSDTEMVHQLLTIYAAGIEVPQNFIANTLLLTMTDLRFTGARVHPSITAALEEVLATDPPMANYCLVYPKHPVEIDGVWLPAHQPVIISMAACNKDVAGDYAGNQSHMAWGTGPHACPSPAREIAKLAAKNAIEQIWDIIPEITLAVPVDELVWRPGPFHRALAALPVTFPPSRPQAVERLNGKAASLTPGAPRPLL